MVKSRSVAVLNTGNDGGDVEQSICVSGSVDPVRASITAWVDGQTSLGVLLFGRSVTGFWVPTC
jgi:hypothetical protein